LAVNSGSTDKLLFLLNNNCSVGAARPDGKTALHLACIRQDFQMVQILVEKGADAGTQDEVRCSGVTELHPVTICPGMPGM
jgi:ankyrin repeat protein